MRPMKFNHNSELPKEALLPLGKKNRETMKEEMILIPINASEELPDDGRDVFVKIGGLHLVACYDNEKWYTDNCLYIEVEYWYKPVSKKEYDREVVRQSKQLKCPSCGSSNFVKNEMQGGDAKICKHCGRAY